MSLESAATVVSLESPLEATAAHSFMMHQQSMPPLNTSILGGFFLTVIIYTTVILLHMLLPGRSVVGYACTDHPDKHDILVYKLNGVSCMVSSISAVLVLLHLNQCVAKWQDPFVTFSPRTVLVFIAQRRLGLLLGSQVTAALAAYYFYQAGSDWNRLHQEKQHNQQQQQHQQLNHGATTYASPTTNTTTTNTILKSPPFRAMSKDDVSRRSLSSSRSRGGTKPWYVDFYRGVGEFNPRSAMTLRRRRYTVDWKLGLFLCRTVMTQILVWSAAATAATGTPSSRALWLTVGMWTWTSLDFLVFEEFFLYSYTVVGERLGFKLIWSVLGVHPFLYNIAIWELLQHDGSSFNSTNHDNHDNDDDSNADDLSTTSVAIIVALFLAGWIISRGAQYQKYMIKTQPSRQRIFFGWIEQRCLHSHRKRDVPSRQLLISGFWGLSKHVNYFGDILQAVALGLPAMLQLLFVNNNNNETASSNHHLVFVYPAWVIWNAIHQQRKDDVMCRKRYGNQAWDDYSERVPYRILPHVY